jgi:uncharacterized membrane protein
VTGSTFYIFFCFIARKFEMSDIFDPAKQEKSLITVGHISYLLHAVVAAAAVVPGAQVSILLLIVAFVIDVVKKDQAVGTWQESHFHWRLRSLLWAAVLYVVTIPLYLLFIVPGFVAWIIISIWFFYRILRGWLSLSDRKAMPMPVST